MLICNITTFFRTNKNFARIFNVLPEAYEAVFLQHLCISAQKT